MLRRTFLSLSVGATLSGTRNAAAQQPQRQRRIAFVHSGIAADKLTEKDGPFWVRRFYAELRRLGHEEGKNLAVERFSAGGSSSRFAPLAAEVTARKPDVIVANHNFLVRALLGATGTIPIVAITTDPVASKLIASFARPGANLTGVSVIAGPGVVSKRLQILKEIVPLAVNVVYLQSSGVEDEISGLPLLSKLLPEVDEQHLRRAFAEMAEQKVGAALISDGGSYLAQKDLIVALAARHRLPVMYPYRDYTEAGGLIAYAPDLAELAARMASDVNEILKGADAGNIPYFQPTKFELVVNLKAANALDLTMPPTLLALANEVIE